MQPTFFKILSRYVKGLLIILVFPLVFVKCKDFIEVDLSGKQLMILTPTDSLQSTVQSIYFKWELLEGAFLYRIQIVSPDFQTIQQFVADSATTNDNFLYTLPPGSYQWRIRAENSTSHTEYQYRKLFVDSTSGLTNQQVVLTTPASNAILNDDVIQFGWQPLFSATEYTIRVTDQQTQSLLFNETISITQHIISTIQEGAFNWEVRALNNSSSTAYTSRQLSIDRTIPPIPEPITSDSIIINTDNLRVEWQRAQDAGIYQSARFDRFYIYTDTSSNPLSTFPMDVDTTFIDLTLPLPNSYFWRLRAIDEAGNQSNFTEFRQITRQ